MPPSRKSWHRCGATALAAALVLFRLALLPAPAGAQEAPAPAAATNRIAEIRVEGTRRTEPDQILLIIRSRVGEAIDRETIAQDVRDLWTLGLYSDIAVDVERGPEGYVLSYRVTERPSVARVEIEGFDEISEEKIREAIGIVANSVYTEEQTEEAKQRVLKLYAAEGFFIANVEVIVDRDTRKNQVALIFRIEENHEVLVRRIEFVGNEAFTDDELKSLDGLITQEKHVVFPMNLISDAGKFREDAFEQDIARITVHYLDNGYLQVKVERPIVALSSDRREIFITIRINEGPQFTLGEVRVAGDLLWPAEELLAPLKSKTGEMFSRKNVLADVENIANRYADEGYAFANVNPHTRPYQGPEGEYRVDLTFVVDKGQEVSVNRILIVGNVKTRDRVIRREMRIVEGERYSRSRFQESRRRIERLGFFESVSYANERVPGAQDKVNVRFEVTERPTGSIQIGAGFSSLEQFFAQASISQQNLFGRGQQLQFQATLGGRVQSALISFTDPRVFDTFWSVSVSVFNIRRPDVGFDSEELGGSLRVGYDLTEVSPLLKDVRASLGLSVRRTKLVDFSASLENFLQDGRLNQNSLSTSLLLTTSHNTLNDFLDPTEGMVHRLDVELGENLFFLGRDTNDFIKYILSGVYYHRLSENSVPGNLVVSGRWRLGLFDRREKTDLLFRERFRGGAITNLRGYSPRSVGPYISTDNGDLVLLGGDKELYFSLELIAPLLPAAKLRAVVFFDAGNVYGDREALLSSLLADAGFGVRWFSPLGPIRFEFGWPLVNNKTHTGRDKVSGPVFNFTIGQFF